MVSCDGIKNGIQSIFYDIKSNLLLFCQVQEEEEELSRSNDEIDETMALASKQPKPSSLQQAGIKRNAAPSPPRIEVVSSSMTNKLQTAPPPASKKRKLPRSRIVFGGSGWMDN